MPWNWVAKVIKGAKLGMNRIEKQKQEIVAMFLPLGDCRFCETQYDMLHHR